MASVIVQDGSGLSLAVALRSPMTLGREPQCELALADAKVSRTHARFEERGGRWWLIDLSSRHGTYVNGERVVERALVPGDRVQVGSSTLVFEAALREPVLAHRTVAEDAAQASRASAGPSRHSLLYFFAEAARQLGDLDAMLASVLAAVVGAFGASRGVVALATSTGMRRVAQVRADDAVIAASILEAVLRRGEGVLITESAPGTTLEAQGVRAAMAAPLRAGARVLGFVYLDARSLSPGGSAAEGPRGSNDARSLSPGGSAAEGPRGSNDARSLSPGGSAAEGPRGSIDARSEGARWGAEDIETLTALATLVGALVEGAARYDRATAAAEAAKLGAPSLPLLGTSAPMLALRRDIERLAPTALSLHLHGESGSGKELVARALHAASARGQAPLVAVNCAALPDALLESELFGHARGAFTGALQPRRGKLALADGGTLFLDEIAELSAAAQAKILRVLEDGEVTPVGAERGHFVDVRVISASHKDLREEVRAGRFREDLFYRLVVAELKVPPLRARGEDVARLAEAFLTAARGKGARARGFSPAALAALAAHDWPGNVRELRNVVERGAALAVGPMIEVEDLRLAAAPLPERRDEAAGASSDSSGSRTAAGTAPPRSLSPSLAPPDGAPPPPTDAPAPSETRTERATGSLAERFAALDVTERALVERALATAQGNVSEAARILGISRIKIKRRLDRYKQEAQGVGAVDDEGAEADS